MFNSTTLAGSCEESIAPKLAQTYYVWVRPPYQTKSNPSGDLEPVYRNLIARLQPGGILVGDSDQTNGKSLDQLGVFTDQLKSLYQTESLPPLVGADYLSVYKNDLHFSDEFQNLGFGTHLRNDASTSLFKLSGDIVKTCLTIVSEIKAIAHRIVGINHPLGPIVEEQIDKDLPMAPEANKNSKLLTIKLQDRGLIPTLKHFPFLVKNKDPHHGLSSSNLSQSVAEKLQENFLVNTKKDYVVMTTHVSSPQIDGGNIVTFSKQWIGELRKKLTDTNLIMTDGLFMLGTYPKQIAQVSEHSSEVITTYFLPRKKKVYKPYNYSQDPCFKALKSLMRKYRNTLPLDLRKEAVEEYKKSSPELESRCSNVIEDYLSFIQPDFDPDEAEKIGTDVITGFVEKSLLAGHDLVILEGYPNVAEAAHHQLIKKACSPTGALFKDKIEAAALRIQRFKQRNMAPLKERATQEWINTHRSELDELFFEVYPAINNPKTLCHENSINKARSLIRDLCRE
ncbi:MAG: hypothetical protein AABY64_05075 [Bdellovibrionota bacterium]